MKKQASFPSTLFYIVFPHRKMKGGISMYEDFLDDTSGAAEVIERLARESERLKFENEQLKAKLEALSEKQAE